MAHFPAHRDLCPSSRRGCSFGSSLSHFVRRGLQFACFKCPLVTHSIVEKKVHAGRRFGFSRRPVRAELLVLQVLVLHSSLHLDRAGPSRTTSEIQGRGMYLFSGTTLPRSLAHVAASAAAAASVCFCFPFSSTLPPAHINFSSIYPHLGISRTSSAWRQVPVGLFCKSTSKPASF